MIGVITGDIINSREADNQQEWLVPIKKVFNQFGKTPKTWEIFRGDSFQLEVEKPEDTFWAAILIKASIRSVRSLDVRMAIGIGEKSHDAARISESNGEAFIHSGEKFENLKKQKQNLAVKTPWPDFDQQFNLMISLASIAMDKWSQSSAELIALSLQHKELSQKELGEKIAIGQSSVSERQKRAHFEEVMELENFYRQQITNRLGVRI
ncbi:SatD family protein [Ferruginibacter sp. HRS2-29]|uniref:SatD family protein n=1 Tax=Ferruginibacter sp. HRS2-29 TaxID=2487334 RepID=UPI0020CC97FC|nr:SatD family protein [Ferruginibacter sp. HRS2-29]MCP9751227.1 transcriptional regulator [Ferruginibacter sp. HRS2-29]